MSYIAPLLLIRIIFFEKKLPRAVARASLALLSAYQRNENQNRSAEILLKKLPVLEAQAVGGYPQGARAPVGRYKGFRSLAKGERIIRRALICNGLNPITDQGV
ncbi:MAG: hypothetical protein H0X29_10800 [Parachlamydiaceae bacterium]|nr:hypothetical protein [Parachlamydiaceae bacterium]